MQKFLRSFFMMFVSVAMFAVEMDTVYYSHLFTSKPAFLGASSTDTLSGVEWTVSDSLVYTGFDTNASARGWQIGKAKAPQPYFALSTSDITAPVNVVRLVEPYEGFQVGAVEYLLKVVEAVELFAV